MNTPYTDDTTFTISWIEGETRIRSEYSVWDAQTGEQLFQPDNDEGDNLSSEWQHGGMNLQVVLFSINFSARMV